MTRSRCIQRCYLQWCSIVITWRCCSTAVTREKMQSLILKIWKETGKTIMIITHSVEEAVLLGERLFVMAPRPGRLHKEYYLPFAERGLVEDAREIKTSDEFVEVREEILTMIWNMEEEIMGQVS